MKLKTLEKNTFLIALMNNKADFLIAQKQHWYRIPVDKAPKNIREGIVEYIAFYHTKVFNEEKYSVQYFSKVEKIIKIKRKYLFPNEPINPKSSKEYFQICFQELHKLGVPIVSKRVRRLLFIPTTYDKFMKAKEINHLFNESPLEEIIWDKLIESDISAERQFLLQTNDKNWILDFAIFCRNGQINVECDGDEFHTAYDDVLYDKFRNNEIESVTGWSVLRFPTFRIVEEPENCIRTIKRRIHLFGGLKLPDGTISQDIFHSPNSNQLTIFSN